MSRLLPLLLAFAIAACASAPKAASLEDNIRALIGRPAGVATARLGNPATIRPQKDGDLYVWTARQPTKRTNENAARAKQIAAALQQNPNAVAAPASCVLTMRLDKAGTIKSFHLGGDPSKCAPFAAALAGGR